MRSVYLILFVAVLLIACGARRVDRGASIDGGDVLKGDPYLAIEQAQKNGRTRDIDIKGGGGDPFRQTIQDGGFLIGFNVGFSQFIDSPIIESLQPIFRTRNGERTGQWIGKPPAKATTVKAKDGFIVTGIDLRVGLRIDAFSLVCARFENGRLNLNDPYNTDWLGGQRGNPERVGGREISIGVVGHTNNEGAPVSLGLITPMLP